MNLINGVKKVIAKVTKNKKKLDKITQDEEKQKLLDKWKKQYTIDKTAKKDWNDRFDEWEAMYHSNREFANVVRQAHADDKNVRTIVNFPRLMVESLIDLNIPDPDIKAVTKDDEEVIEALKNEVAYIIRSMEPGMVEINMENERRCSKVGAFFKVHYNNTIKKAGYVGDIEITNPHSKDIIPNKGATKIYDMEHYHHPVNRTGKYITRKWKHITLEDLEDKAQLEKEYDLMEGTQRIPIDNSSNEAEKSTGLNKYTIIETTYKDQEGDICKFWWSGDLYIEHLPKFYYRRDENGNPIEKEPLDEDIQVRAGLRQVKDIDPQTGQEVTREEQMYKTIPMYREVPGINPETNEPEMGQVPNEIEPYIPKCWDIIYWPFIPRDKCFWGISIMEDIKDIQEAIKKQLFIYEEKLLRGQKKIIVDDEDLKRKLLDPLSEIIVVKDPGSIKEVNMGNEMDGLVFIEKLKEWMQLITGATNPVLGQESTKVTSGKQAQTYIEQANFKVALKSACKIAAYRQLYRVVTAFVMAFCDNDRPFRMSGDRNKEVYGVFNRMNMLRDLNGNLIWPDYDIDAGAETGFMKSKPQILDSITTLAGAGKFEPSPGNLIYLKIMQKLGIPYLEDVIEDMEKMVEQQKTQQSAAYEQQILQKYMSQLPPDIAQAIMSQFQGQPSTNMMGGIPNGQEAQQVQT